MKNKTEITFFYKENPIHHTTFLSTERLGKIYNRNKKKRFVAKKKED